MINADYKNILNEISIPILGFENGEVVWANNLGKEILYIKDVMELKEKNVLKYLHNKQVDGKSLRDIVMEIGKVFDGEVSINKINVALKIKGIRVESSIKIVPIQSEYPNSGIVIFSGFQRKKDGIDDKLLGMHGVYKDLREESKINKELEIQSQSFNKLFESSLDAMAFLDLNQKILDINKSFSDLFGYKVEECKGIDINNLIVSNEYRLE